MGKFCSECGRENWDELFERIAETTRRFHESRRARPFCDYAGVHVSVGGVLPWGPKVSVVDKEFVMRKSKQDTLEEIAEILGFDEGLTADQRESLVMAVAKAVGERNKLLLDAETWRKRLFRGSFKEADVCGDYGMFGFSAVTKWRINVELSERGKVWRGGFHSKANIYPGVKRRVHLVADSGMCWDGEAVVLKSDFEAHIYEFEGSGAPLIDGKELG